MRAYIRDMFMRMLQATVDYLQESKKRSDHKEPTAESSDGTVPWSETLEAHGDDRKEHRGTPRSRDSKTRGHEKRYEA